MTLARPEVKPEGTPVNRTRQHAALFDPERPGAPVPADSWPVGTYYPVNSALIESGGDLLHRIRMFYAFVLTGTFAMTEGTVGRIRTSKTLNTKLRQVVFHSCILPLLHRA